MESQRICRDFARGNCSWKNCKFAHVRSSQNRRAKAPASPASADNLNNPTQHPEPRQVQGLPTTEKALRAWQRSLPLHTARIRPSSGKKTTLFQKARQLIESDASIRQEVIRTLASEDGLRLILDLVQENFEDMDDPTRDIIFKTQVLPFLETVTNHEVLSSLILEQAVGTIYNVLFGLDGSRAARWLSFVCGVLEMDTPNEGSAMLLEASLHAFSRIADLNSTALIQDCLHAVAQRFEVVLSAMKNKAGMNARLCQSQLHLDHLLQRLETGKLLPAGIPNRKPANQKESTFMTQRETPGGRHNNDFDDICQIGIMPSVDEICCPQTEYLPGNNPFQWHLDGIDGLLDRNFRLLREDTVGQLRDAIHHELNPRSQLPQLRKFVYPNCFVQNLAFNWLSGFYFEVDFPQPLAVKNYTALARETWWQNSKRLQPGALVCLILEKDIVLFCTVTHRDMSPRRKKDPVVPQDQAPAQKRAEPNTPWKSSTRGSVTLMLVDSRHTNARSVLHLFSSRKPVISLVEFPGVILPAFDSTLRALQSMKLARDLPFSELFVPWAFENASIPNVPPPVYASQPGFAFNLRCLMENGSNFYIRANQPSDMQYLLDHSKLDRAQSYALVGCLKQKLGLIQGPPGTGKSYTGVALIKVLLANRDVSRTRLGPILCVTYTNHALDQLLESLLDNNVTSQIIRIGSQSKSERLEKFSLQNVAKETPRTKMEKKERWSTAERLSLCEDDFRALDVKKDISASRLKSYIQRNDPCHHDQLFSLAHGDGFQRSKKDSPQSAITSWLDSGPKDNARVRSVNQLEDINVYRMTRKERQRLYNHWYQEYQIEIEEKVMQIISSHKAAKSGYDNVQDEMHLRCLAQADVIGATTSGLARRLDMFRRLPCKFMLCEEAGEVLESHLLTAFLPSVEHAVLIGDQQQLRPQIQNYDLSSENTRGGAQYSLDISLFERLVSSNKSPMDCNMPFSTLETQRRMHPSIASLIRETLYPSLKNAPSVSEYPEVSGMRKRLYWLDHRHQEGECSEGDPMSTSHWNTHEIDMTVSLVNHLVQQGEYKNGDIAVLTPYLGQLHRLRKRLNEFCAIIMGDRDQNDLEQAGFADEAKDNAPTKGTLSQTLRVATVDNFQGEEAKIVVISLVRSNAQNNCGFLRTSNRINVLLSRAQHGMYIIGNSETSIHVPMWAQVVKILERDDNIGRALQLQCPRHPNTPITVSMPEDFPRLSPEGGCNLRCVSRLGCGHACVQKCHSDLIHNAVFCLERCPRPLDGCNHSCPKSCGDPCPKRCMVNVYQKYRTLPCGHLMPNLPCWQSQDLSTVGCLVRVKKTVPGCNHVVSLVCHIDVGAKDYRCITQCRSHLPCGHSCKKMCYRCVTRGPDTISVEHGTCEQQCDRNQSTCAHPCSALCHGEKPCPPCRAPCDVQCGHSKCPRRCYEPCTPCAEEKCLSRCPHSICSMPCAAPCDHVPCSKRCEKRLSCGHRCPSVCGEKCPPSTFCQRCANNEIQKHQVDFIEGQMYKEINLDKNPCIFPRCGHFLTIENMDAQMDMATHYKVDIDGKPTSIRKSSAPFSVEDIKTCATCRGPLRDIARYGRLIRRAILDESTKKLILLLNREYVPLAQELPGIVRELQATEGQRTSLWPPVIELCGPRIQQIQNMAEIMQVTNPGRWGRILDLRKRIEAYGHRVKPEEQPFERVRRMMENARKRRKATANLDHVEDVLQTKGFLQGTALLFRLDIVLLVDLLDLVSKGSASGLIFELDFQRIKDDCHTLIQQSTTHHRLLQQTEGYVFLAQLYALEQAYCSSREKKKKLLERGRHAVSRARYLCDEYPGQTRGLAGEVDGVEMMLREGTFYTIVTNEERMAVISAMAQEFSGTGHWYYCRNGHPFTIGECGGAIEMASCPECDAPVGGEDHEVAEGVTRAEDLEQDMEGLSLQR